MVPGWQIRQEKVLTKSYQGPVDKKKRCFRLVSCGKKLNQCFPTWYWLRATGSLDTCCAGHTLCCAAWVSLCRAAPVVGIPPQGTAHVLPDCMRSLGLPEPPATGSLSLASSRGCEGRNRKQEEGVEAPETLQEGVAGNGSQTGSPWAPG